MDTAACKRRFSLGCIPLTDRAVIREPTRQDDLFFFHRDAIGCGQNMAQGIEELAKSCVGRAPPPTYESAREDSGNGSVSPTLNSDPDRSFGRGRELSVGPQLIRLAAVPIFFARAPESQLLEAARMSSYATHPGAVAAEACAFLAFLVRAALMEGSTSRSTRTFLDDTCAQYVRLHLEGGSGEEAGSGRDSAAGARRLLMQLLCVDPAPPSPGTARWDSQELGWAWRCEHTFWGRTLENRGSRYNGYPVSASELRWGVQLGWPRNCALGRLQHHLGH